MNFREDLARKVMAGEKTVTRRLVSDNPRSPWWGERCSYRVGQDVAVCPGRCKHAIGRAAVTAVSLERLGNITDAEARAEGFAGRPAFVDAWAAINGRFDPMAIVWRVGLRAIAPVSVRKAATVADVVEVVRRHRFRHATENELQAGLAAALGAGGYRVVREARLSARDRIDLLVDTIGVEVKIAGVPRDVDRQLLRYAQSARITGLVLVTNRARHRPPVELNGKPVAIASLLGAGL